MVKKFLTQSVGYGAAEAGKQVISLLLLPLYARFLTPEDYGIVCVLAVASGILGTVLAWGMNSAVVRYLFIYTDPERQRTFLTSMVAVLIGSSVLLCAGCWLLGGPVFQMLFPRIPVQPFLPLVVWSAFFSLAELIPMTYLWATERLRSYTVLSLGTAGMRMVLIFLMVAVYQRGAAGKLEGDILAGIGTAMVLGAWFSTKLAWRFSWRLIREPLAFGVPLVLHHLALLLLHNADRVLLQRVVSLDQVAVYSVGYTLGSSLNFFAVAMCRAWLPDFFSTAEQEGGRRRFAQRLVLYTAVLGACALVLAVFSRELVRLLAGRLYVESEAALIMPCVLIGYLAFSMYYVGAHLLKFARASGVLVHCTILGAAVNIALNLFWIQWWGIWGAVWATLAAFVVLWAGSWVAARRHYAAPMEGRRLASWIGATVAGVAAATSLVGYAAWWSLIPRAAILGLYALSLVRLLRRMHSGDEEAPSPSRLARAELASGLSV